MKQYKVIFFDWDGTAVLSRTASADTVIQKMIPLLREGTKLIIISGTTYNNIAGGTLHSMLPKDCLGNLYLGLGRGAYNYGFNKNGELILLHSLLLNKKKRLKIDKVAFDLHCHLLDAYEIQTDIVFSRPNYCKIDLMVENDRQENLFMQKSEIEQVKNLLVAHGYQQGLQGLLKLAEKMGMDHAIQICATTDAKYLEIGISTKSDNVDYFMKEFVLPSGLSEDDCCFWGDEFRYLDEGVCGSDAFMITPLTIRSAFFDVSGEKEHLPPQVTAVGGSVNRFLAFLDNQISR